MLRELALVDMMTYAGVWGLGGFMSLQVASRESRVLWMICFSSISVNENLWDIHLGKETFLLFVKK